MQNLASNPKKAGDDTTAVAQKIKMNMFCSIIETGMVHNFGNFCIPAHLHLQV